MASLQSVLAPFRENGGFDPIALDSAQEAFDELCRLYDQETARIQNAYKAFKSSRDTDGYKEVSIRGYYPYVRISVSHEHVNLEAKHAYGVFREEGEYVLNVTDPRAYNDLLGELSKLQDLSPVPIRFEVGLSDEEIPLFYAIRDLNFNLQGDLASHTKQAEKGKRKIDIAGIVFTPKNPDLIADYVSSDVPPEGQHLILPYNGQRFDHAMHQFHYYTGTPWEALQPFVIFSNYDPYVAAIQKWAEKQMSQEFNSGAGTNRPEVIAVVRTGHDVKIKEGYENDDVLNRIKAITERRRTKVPQMPSCHVLMSDGLGISMINAGVSAPNVVNIADLIAPKRSMLWAMAGHSAGLSRTQKIGDYVYGDSYFVNPMMPNLTGTGFDYSTIMPLSCPTSSEFQRAIEKSVGRHASEIDIDVGDIYTRAALVSTDYRIWERFVKTRQGLQEVRAATLEMETAYLALKANEQSIPYGAFLKVSDIPHFDKPKTTASADGFFEDIGSHLGLIIEAIEVVKAEYADDLASRKFRPRQGPGLFVAR